MGGQTPLSLPQLDAAGNFVFTITTKFIFGDLVAYDSINGRGEGVVIDIAAQQEGRLRYEIYSTKTNEIQPGVYEDEMRLLDRLSFSTRTGASEE